MTKPLQGRVALVTGASRGIGRSAALAFAEAGAHVIALARTAGALEELDDEIVAIGGSATLVPLDLSDAGGLEKLGHAVTERWGKLDILLANAGILGSLSPLDHVPRRTGPGSSRSTSQPTGACSRRSTRRCALRMPAASY
mgnify:CR=1 FL=1